MDERLVLKQFTDNSILVCRVHMLVYLILYSYLYCYCYWKITDHFQPPDYFCILYLLLSLLTCILLKLIQQLIIVSYHEIFSGCGDRPLLFPTNIFKE